MEPAGLQTIMGCADEQTVTVIAGDLPVEFRTGVRGPILDGRDDQFPSSSGEPGDELW